MEIKLKNHFALLALMMFALLAELAILQYQQTNDYTYNILTNLAIRSNVQLTPIKQPIPTADKITIEKVALAGVTIPLYPGAKRLTFDSGNSVSYRLSVPAYQIAAFYNNQNMASQGWSQLKQVPKPYLNSKNLDKLTIALKENPAAKRTEVTYAYLSPQSIKVLGMELAQDNSTPPPSDQGSVQPPVINNQQPMQPQQTQQQQQFQQPMSGQNQTCRVNGVDMPGSCDLYNNGTSNSSSWGRPGQNGQPGQPSQMGQSMQQGPSEEDMKKMDEQRFNNMKKGLSQFTNGIKSMKKSITRVKTAIAKCGVNMPEELTSAMTNTDSLVSKIQAAQNADELDEIIGDVQDTGAVMQDWGPRLGDLQRLCQMIKQADKDMKQLDRSLKQDESRAKANKKIDISEIISDFKTNINGLRETLTQVKELAKTDAEAALEKLEDDFYGQMDNVRNNEQAIQMTLNISKGITDVTRELKNYEKQLNTLKKKKIDTSEADGLLATLKDQIMEIKNFIKTKFDADELVDKVQTAYDTRQQLLDALQALGIGTNLTPQIKNTQTYNTQINLPDAFKKPPDNGGQDNQGAETGGQGVTPVPDQNQSPNNQVPITNP